MDTRLGSVYQNAVHLLTASSDTARLDAELLISHVLAIPRTQFITQPDMEIETQKLDQITALITQRKQGVPVAYLIGKQHFWDVELTVTRDTLIPRPETELLVETALALFSQQEAVKVLDLGTGSGAIAIAIANARPGWKVLATDIASDTLKVARENARRYQLTNLQFAQGNWFDAIDSTTRFDVIMSNPPYVADNDPHLQQGDVKHEPSRALTSGTDGLSDIRYLLANSQRYLTTGGWLLLEHGYDQGQQVDALFESAGYSSITQRRDLAGHIRMTYGQSHQHG